MYVTLGFQPSLCGDHHVTFHKINDAQVGTDTKNSMLSNMQKTGFQVFPMRAQDLRAECQIQSFVHDDLPQHGWYLASSREIL